MEKKYKRKEFANLLGITVQTLHNWENSNVLIPKRTLGGLPYYTDEHLLKLKYVGDNYDNLKKYTQKEFSVIVGVTVQTLNRWSKRGILIPKRTLGGKPYYTDEDIKTVKENTF